MATTNATSKFTYEDFEKAYKNSGYFFSDGDLALAKENPDAGMSILSYKRDYANATTDEARAAANAGAEAVRSSWGGYTGGTDGSSFYKNDLSYRDYAAPAAPEAPTSTGTSDTTAALKDKVLGYGSFTSTAEKPTYASTAGDKPTYSSSAARPTYGGTYVGEVDSQLNNVLNYGDFSYDPATDQLYSAYRKEYAREGQRATADALATAAAASGGIASSYANTAASQAGDYYASQLTDKIPELYQIAYNKYLNDYSMAESKLSAAQSVEQQDYNKYLNELSQYNTDRNFDLSKYQVDLGQYNADRTYDLSKYQVDLGQYNTDRNFDYQAYLDGYNMAANNLSISQAADDTEWNHYLALLDQYNTDRAFGYGQHSDEVAQQNYLKEVQTAKEESDRNWAYNVEQGDREWLYNLGNLGAQYSDYTGLNRLGIDTEKYQTDQEYKTKMDQALTLAQSAGDYTYLEELGVDVSNFPAEWEKSQANFENQLAIAEIWAGLGKTSYLAALSGGGTPTAGTAASGSSGGRGSSSGGKGSSSSSSTSAKSTSTGTASETWLKTISSNGAVSADQYRNLVAVYGASAVKAAGITIKN